MNYDTALMDELMAEFVRLGNDLSIIAEERRKIDIEIQRREREAGAKIRLRSVTPLQREAIMKVLSE